MRAKPREFFLIVNDNGLIHRAFDNQRAAVTEWKIMRKFEIWSVKKWHPGKKPSFPFRIVHVREVGCTHEPWSCQDEPEMEKGKSSHEGMNKTGTNPPPTRAKTGGPDKGPEQNKPQNQEDVTWRQWL
jgi:hypothetical protein